jgi:hypothetical protein
MLVQEAYRAPIWQNQRKKHYQTHHNHKIQHTEKKSILQAVKEKR